MRTWSVAEHQANTGGSRDRPWWHRPDRLLILVAVVHAVSPLLVLGPHWWFGVDETVYLSQINHFVPAGAFTAPRARGTTLLAAPVTLLTSSTVAVRLWLAALSGLGLYVAYRPWSRVYPARVVVVAALLFASLWPTIFYGFEAMPNEWVALASVWTCGHLAIQVRTGGRRSLIPIAIGMAVVALLRPSDAGFLLLGLLAGAAVLTGPLRRRAVACVVAALGAGIGLVQWVVEARTSFGGVQSRIAAAQAENGGGGLHWGGAQQFRTLGGPALCRGRCSAHSAPVYQLWWFVLAVLLVVAVWTAYRAARLRRTMLPIAAGALMGAQYLFTVPYGAPRFLLPAYALLSIPAASAVIELVRRAGPVRARRVRPVLVGVLSALLLGHVAVQVVAVEHDVAPAFTRFNRQVLADARALQRAGLRRPCVVIRNDGLNQNLAYAAHCTNVPRSATALRAEVRRGGDVVWFSRRTPPPRFGFVRYRLLLPGPDRDHRQPVYVSFRPSGSAVLAHPGELPGVRA